MTKDYLDKTGLAYFWSKIKAKLSGKQDTLVSGTNIKTVNNTALLGSGNISIPVITVDSVLNASSTNPVQNKVINTALANKLPDYTIETRPTWTGGVHPMPFLTVDYTNDNSENASFFKIGMICTHGNGNAYRYFQDIIVNVQYTGAVTVDIYRYFAETIPSSQDYRGHKYGDIFWTVDTTGKIARFYVLNGPYTRLKSTPYKFLGNTDRGVITQLTGGEDYSGDTPTNWASIGDLGILRRGTTRPSYNGSDLALFSDIPSIMVDSTLSSTSTNPVQNKTINTALEAKANEADLAESAFSGDYDDLINTPSGIHYATSSTGANDNAKIATTATGNFKLVVGATVQVYFQNRCSGSPATLNVDGTGNIRITTKGNAATGTYNIWEAGEIVGFTYTGTYWVCWGRNTASLSGYGRTYLTESATADYNYTSLTPSSLNNFAQNIVAGAPVYSAASTYAVGARCRYGFYVYECKTAITTPEAWNASHWTALNPLQKQIDDLKAEIVALKNGT